MNYNNSNENVFSASLSFLIQFHFLFFVNETNCHCNHNEFNKKSAKKSYDLNEKETDPVYAFEIILISPSKIDLTKRDSVVQSRMKNSEFESLPGKDLIILPNELLEYQDFFNEKSAEKLPPHRPYDCQINLIANSKLYYGPIYPLTDTESKVLEE